MPRSVRSLGSDKRNASAWSASESMLGSASSGSPNRRHENSSRPSRCRGGWSMPAAPRPGPNSCSLPSGISINSPSAGKDDGRDASGKRRVRRPKVSRRVSSNACPTELRAACSPAAPKKRWSSGKVAMPRPADCASTGAAMPICSSVKSGSLPSAARKPSRSQCTGRSWPSPTQSSSRVRQPLLPAFQSGPHTCTPTRPSAALICVSVISATVNHASRAAPAKRTCSSAPMPGTRLAGSWQRSVKRTVGAVPSHSPCAATRRLACVAP